MPLHAGLEWQVKGNKTEKREYNCKEKLDIKMRIYFTLLGLILISLVKAEESKNEVGKQSWLTYSQGLVQNARFAFSSDFAWRQEWALEDWTRLHARATVKYNFYETVYPLAQFGTFYNITDIGNALELRPVVGVQAKWPDLTYFSLDNTMRIENRNVFVEDLNEWEGSLRLRYRLKLISSEIFTNAQYKLSLEIWDEYFTSLNNSTFYSNQNRLGVGLKLRDKSRHNIHLNYFVQLDKPSRVSPRELEQHIIQLIFTNKNAAFTD